MEIKRQQEIVEAYHYDMRVPDSEVETDLRVSFSPIEVEEENYPENSSALVARLEFRIVFDEFVLSGAISQINHIIDRKIEKQDISQEEVDELVRPLFSIVERLSYEVTEIALDRPGVQLNFQQSEEA
ncbi:DUF1149 family protein [Enterococcus faecalis]|uniref:DUF1149 family protein n=1 Tax=Enterococcus faecalis TaxID=1351 RepID=UPI0015583E83|nr:DUF1149 family protein [Enterococcus faecalis]BDQ53114.1 hypothetical protein EfsSVR2330_06250 [Enterococcus faecalis]